MATTLPREILHHILRLATSVPSAFDTSVDGSSPDKESEVSLAIDKSTRSKLALCCVSKYFYEIAIELLYEIVTIRSPKKLFRLARRFHVPSRTGGNPRGWWCRRLELSFAQVGHIYDGNDWESEGKSLWGLPDACPNLVVLIANITRTRTSYGGSGYFPIPRTLFQTIAHTCAKTLRRFEMCGDTGVGFDRVEMLLRCCPVIEICRLNQVTSREFLGSNFAYDSIDKVYQDDWSEWGYEAPIEESPAEVVRWPQLIDAPESLEDAPLILPHLHTLEIMHGSVVQANWSLPSLRTLGMKFYSEHERRGDPLGLITERLADVLPYAQITRLSYSGTTPILWGIINSFPNLVEFNSSSGDMGFFPRRPELLLHAHLARIKFCPASLDALEDFLDRINQAHKNGLLPALEKNTGVWVYP